MPHRLVHLLWILPALLIVSAPSARAQQPDGAPALDAAGSNPQSLYGKDLAQGVYVRDSAVAVEKLALADHLKHLKEWGKSAEVYQEILQKYGDRVVPAQIDAANNIYQYTSVSRAVQERLAKWPKEGIDVYRARYEAEARTIVEMGGDDIARLHRVYALYFITDSARVAGMRLIELHLEAGEFAAAAWIGDRLLALHPNISAERPRLLYLTAVAYHLAGNAPLAQAKLAELKKDHADAKATIRGEEVALADSLEKALQSEVPFAVSSAKDEWLMPFGSLDRARVPDVEGYGGARMVSVPIATPDLHRLIANPGQRGEAQTRDKNDRELGLMTGVMPVVDGGEMFFQDNARVYAVSLESGLPLPGWASTYDGERNGRYAINAIPTPRNLQYTVALSEDSVLAVMGQADLTDAAMGFVPFQMRDTRLICLDRQTGVERWVTTPAKLPPEIPALRSLDFSGSPLILGDSVFIIGRSAKPVQFEDCYVLCFELASGKYKWATYVCSASAQAQMLDGDYSASEVSAHLAYASGRIYALSNLGALAAIDAYDGTIAWLNVYPRAISNVRFPGQLGWSRIRTSETGGNRPWQINPTIVADGKVFVLPGDSKNLLVYDAGTGVEIKRIRLSDVENADQLLAVIGEKLVLASPRDVSCINWKNYDAEKFSRMNGDMVYWIAAHKTGETTRGRGFVTRDWTYIATNERLWRIDLRTGKKQPVYPQEPDKKKWDAEVEGPGNVLVVPDHVIVAGGSSVDVYTDLQVVQRKLDAEVAAAPSDPEPRLRYAEMMFVSGRIDLALPRLDEAISLLGGPGAMKAGHDRDRVFNNAMTFAQKLASEDDAKNRETISGLYDRAAGAASTPTQQVNYRLKRARFAGSIGKSDLEVRLYQELLSEPSLRTVSVNDADAGGLSPAGSIAEHAISSAIERSARSVYAPFEESAAREFEIAKGQGPAALLDVAGAYPNASIAPTALITAAGAFEAAGDHREAIQALRQAYLKYPEISNRAEVLESLARNYLASPGKADVAVARLAQAAKISGGVKLSRPLKLPDGQVLDGVTLSSALATVQNYQSQQSSLSLPDFHLPPYTTVEERKRGVKNADPFLPALDIADNVTAIVTPLPDHRRLDRVVVFAAPNDLSVFAIGQSKPLYTTRAIVEAPRSVAWAGDSLIIFTVTRAAMLKPTGELAWQSPIQNLPALDDEVAAVPAVPVAPDPEQLPRVNIIRRRFGNRQIRAVPVLADPAPRVEQISQARVAGDRVIFGTNTGRVGALDADGNLLWQSRPGTQAVTQLLATDDFVAFSMADDRTVQLCAVDLASGQTIYRRSFTRENQFPINLALSPDGKLVYLTQDQLCAKDLFEPGDKLSFAMPGVRRDNGQAAYAGAVLPDHLLIEQGRILVVAENGEFIHLFSLDNGQRLKFAGSNGQQMDGRFPTEAKDWRVALQSAGSRVYAIGQRATLVAYNLDHLGDSWDRFTERDAWQTRDAIIGKNHVLVLDEPVTPAQPDRSPTLVRMNFYSRALSKQARESGLNEFVVSLNDPSGIKQWQAVDGGLYYLSGDNKLRFLRGARKEG